METNTRKPLVQQPITT